MQLVKFYIKNRNKTMSYIPKFEDFARINEASTMTKGIPTELFNAIKGVQIGIRVAGKNLNRKADKNPPARFTDSEIENMPTMEEAITPHLTSIGWMNNPNIKVEFDTNSKYLADRGEVKIFIGKYIKIEFRLSYRGPYEQPFYVEVWNNVKYTLVKRAEFYGDLNDQVQAIKNIIDANMDVWNAAMNQAPQSTADEFLDDPDIQRVVQRHLKSNNSTWDLVRGIVGVSLFEAEPGAERKNELQDAIKFIQKYLNDKDFINADVKHRLSGRNNILNKDGDWE